MLFCEAYDKDIFINFKYSQYKSTAHMKSNNFGKIFDFTDKRNVFDDPDVYHLDNTVQKALEDPMQYFQRLKRKMKTK